MALLGGHVESVEIDAGPESGGLEVAEAEEVAEDLLVVVLRGDVERRIPVLRLRGHHRRHGPLNAGVRALHHPPDAVQVPRPDCREEGLDRLVRQEPQIHSRSLSLSHALSLPLGIDMVPSLSA